MRTMGGWTSDHIPSRTDEKVEGEMTRLLFRSAGFGLFSNAVLAVVLVGGTREAFPVSLHVCWLSAVSAYWEMRC